MTETVHASATPRFHIEVERTSSTTARAHAHGSTLELAIKGGDPSLGFTPPETLLAAFGACILSNINRDAAEAGLQVTNAEVVFDGVKRNDPLGIDQVRYRVTIESPEPRDALQELYRKATTDGTATNALLHGLEASGELRVKATG